MFQDALKFAKQVAANRGTILFVGTKRQSREIIAEEAARAGMPYIDSRWLGGTLTNFKTVKGSLKRLKDMAVAKEAGDWEKLSKKEALTNDRDLDKLQKALGGIQDLNGVPDAIFVVDVGYHKIAITEANKLGIPVIAILDTNCDPDDVTIGIPGNDDAIRSIELLTRVIADAAADGMIARHNKGGEEAEPLAEWERELLEQGTAAAEAVAAPAETATETVEAPAEAVAVEEAK